MIMQKDSHRQDIDWLRSIAVLLVVFNHAGFRLFSGGYAGVDIIFVISGFLITAIIFNGLLTSTFSFATFYVRLIKRLMPALFVVLVVTIFALLMLRSLLAIFWKDIPKLPQLLMHLISIFGLGLIIYAALFLDKESSYPGFNALYSTVGTGCILLANREYMGCVNRVLAPKPFVIGLIHTPCIYGIGPSLSLCVIKAFR